MQSWRQYQQIKQIVREELSTLPKYRLLASKPASDSSGENETSNSQDTNLERKLSVGALPEQCSNTRQIEQKYQCQQDEGVKTARMLKGVEIEEKNGKLVFVVRVEGKDHQDKCNAHNWSRAYKWTATAIIGSAGALVGWASSIDSGALQQGVEEFGVSEVAQSLTTGLFLIAFGLGALFAAPLSETNGRNPTYILTLTLFCCFTLGSALVPNFGGLLVMRFISGFFAATPLVTFGGSTSDMWSAIERTYVFPVCACLSFIGPFLAPMVGSFIGQSSVISWRWVYWVSLIFGFLVLSAITLFMPETYQPELLSWKAKHLRGLTGDSRFKSEQDCSDATFLGRLYTSMKRPIHLFMSEPMVFLFSFYLVVVYIILFGFLTAYPFIFQGVYHFSQGSVGLAYIGMNFGFLIAFMMIFPVHKKYVRDLERARLEGKEELPPESRLIFALVGAPWLPISLFWMAWTTYSTISYWSCLIATAVFGFATMTIFISTYLYLIDSYTIYAASALVGVTLLRYIAAGIMVPVTIPMYKNLGHHWALTLLALISTIATPIPYIFQRYGAKIRARSKFAQS